LFSFPLDRIALDISYLATNVPEKSLLIITLGFQLVINTKRAKPPPITGPRTAETIRDPGQRPGSRMKSVPKGLIGQVIF
jgi:hypothetical protein